MLHIKQETTSTGTSFFRKFPGAGNHIPIRIALQQTSFGGSARNSCKLLLEGTGPMVIMKANAWYERLVCVCGVGGGVGCGRGVKGWGEGVEV